MKISPKAGEIYLRKPKTFAPSAKETIEECRDYSMRKFLNPSFLFIRPCLRIFLNGLRGYLRDEDCLDPQTSSGNLMAIAGLLEFSVFKVALSLKDCFL
jgi:hypothetical protein